MNTGEVTPATCSECGTWVPRGRQATSPDLILFLRARPTAWAERWCIVADYLIRFDGGSRGNGTDNAEGYGSYSIEAADGRKVLQRLDFGTGVTNNEAEYRALQAAVVDLHGRISKVSSPANFSLVIQGDSSLVINQLQVTKPWKCKAPNLIQYRNFVRDLLATFGSVSLQHVGRDAMVAEFGH